MKTIIDHTGSCSGHHFQMGVETDLPEEVINALGSHAKVMEPEVKEVKPEKNRMIRKVKVITK